MPVHKNRQRERTNERIRNLIRAKIPRWSYANNETGFISVKVFSCTWRAESLKLACNLNHHHKSLCLSFSLSHLILCSLLYLSRIRSLVLCCLFGCWQMLSANRLYSTVCRKCNDLFLNDKNNKNTLVHSQPNTHTHIGKSNKIYEFFQIFLAVLARARCLLFHRSDVVCKII